MNVDTSPEVQQLSALERRRAAPSSTNLSIMDELGASAEVRAVFAQYRERFARTELPGILLCFATNPGLLKSMMQIAGGLVFGDSLLSQRHKEMIATYISRQNDCPYCADSHAVALEAQGGSPEIIRALQHGELDAPLFTTAELALLKFAGKVNANSPAVIRADVETMMHAGWTKEQVEETVHIASLFAAFNRIANGFGLPSPFHSGLNP